MSNTVEQIDTPSETQYEDQHVHQVYNNIASHFSSTRFKPWPVVDNFLRALPPASIGLDIGCGNGKYLTVRKDVYIVASDRSSELLKFAAQQQPHDTTIADTLSLPHPHATFDFAISIAVIHHLSTRDRRREAVRSILQTLKPARGRQKGGEALIFVWALEQKGSRRGWDVGHEQDVLVPWVLKDSAAPTVTNPGKRKSKRKVKSDNDDTTSAAPVSDPNTTVTTTTTTTSSKQDPDRNEESNTGVEKIADQIYQRYYHLYRENELESDIEAVNGTVVNRGYDRDNWWAICTPKI